MAYSAEIIDRVWEKARATGDRDRSKWRKDECGAWMFRDHYGSTASNFGWKIENVSPGGDDSVGNLRPLHHGNHFDRAVGHAHCAVTADREDIQPTAQVGEPKNRPV